MALPTGMEAWYKTWFDSPYYAMLYRHRDDDEAQFFIDSLVHSVALPPGGRVLDLACGTGRHSAYLRRLGYEVVGVDLSTARVERARQLHQQPDDTRLQFHQGDMRHLLDDGRPAWAERPFDLVLNLFTSIGYFNEVGENQQALHQVRQLLAPNGYFIIDFFNADKVVRELRASEELQIDGVQFEIRRRVEHEHIVKRIRITDGPRMLHFSESVQLLHLREFERLLKREQLSLVRTWGDYGGAPFDELESDRLILFAQPV